MIIFSFVSLLSTATRAPLNSMGITRHENVLSRFFMISRCCWCCSVRSFFFDAHIRRWKKLNLKLVFTHSCEIEARAYISLNSVGGERYFFGGKSKLLSLISFHFSTSGSLTPFNETNDCLLQRSPQKNARRVEECEYIKLYNLKKKTGKERNTPTQCSRPETSAVAATWDNMILTKF